MTLQQLIHNARATANMFNTWDIPVKFNGKDIIDITFEPVGSNDEGYIINMEIKE